MPSPPADPDPAPRSAVVPRTRRSRVASACMLVPALLLAAGACGDGAIEVVEPEPCMLQPLPLSGTPGAPTVTDVTLELQPGEGVVVVATATDPQGDADLRDVVQAVGVFPDLECRGAPLVVRDDLAGSGVEETFGTAVDAATRPDLYAAIEAEAGWPVEVDFADAGGSRTTGRVLARVAR